MAQGSSFRLLRCVALLVVVGACFVLLFSSPAFSEWRTTPVVVNTPTATTRLKTNMSATKTANQTAHSHPPHGVFIVGCGHSGTSILTRAVSQLPGIRCAIEYESNVLISHRNTLPSTLNSWTQDALKHNFTTWVEKTPSHIRYVGRILGDPSLRVIYIIRDGRAVSNSIKGRSGDFRAGVKRWVNDNGAIRPLLGEKQRILSIKYEDFANKTKVLGVLRDIYTFLGRPGGDVGDDRLMMSLAPLRKDMNKTGPVKSCEKFLSEDEKVEVLRSTLSHAGNEPIEHIDRWQHANFRKAQMGIAFFEHNESATNMSSEDSKVFYSNKEAVDLMKLHNYL